MRIYIPQYISDALDEIRPYLENRPDGTFGVREDAPYYIKDAYLAIQRWSDWPYEYFLHD